ncbi:response regulator [Candidatus Acetothermia bacterium]|nr:response regulator [Candidatus Acetothermia bacterium]
MQKLINEVSILMADDDADDRMMAREAFEEARLLNVLQFVEDGQELIDYLKKRGKHQSRKGNLPGLVLLDLNMPKKDGRQALEEIKADPDLRQIPVVILTTSKAEEDIVKSYKLGASGYITKPVSFEGLVEIIKALRLYWLEIVELPPNER